MSADFFRFLSEEHGIDLNEQQKEATMHTDGPALILAVPGGGKTTTLLARTAYLIKEAGVHPGNILSITYSKASAVDMKTRFEAIYGVRNSNFSTIHSFSYRVVMNYYRSKGINPRLIEGVKTGEFSKNIILRNLFLKYNHDFISDGELDILVNDISFVKNSFLHEEEWYGYDSDIDNFDKILKAYERLKKDKLLIDFDDMLVKCYVIFSKSSKLLKAYSDRYQYIQVDEGQDTSLLQHRIIYLLAKVHRNVFYVADDDQSIYGFRAAAPDFLLNINETYPKAMIYRMEENYRSTKQIVGLSNRFIKANKHRYGKEIFTNNGDGEKVHLVEAKSRFTQISEISQEIENSSGESIAVLYRNNQSAIAVAGHLLSKRVPFYLKEIENRFFSHFTVSDILSIFEFALYPYDFSQFNQIYYRLRGYYISKKMMENSREAAKKFSNEEPWNRPEITDLILKHNALNEYQRENVERLKRNLKSLGKMSPKEGINYILDIMGYQEYLMDRAGTSDTAYDTYLDMINLLKNLAKDCENLEELSVNIRELENSMKNSGQHRSKSLVTLTTIHSSKGLEWDKVYMIDLIEGIFPNRDVAKAARQGEMAGLEEERRLFYVAMTRAKKKLTLLTVKDGNNSIFTEEVIDCLKQERLNQKLNIGDKVRHKAFGEGIIVKKSHKNLNIQFNKGIKKLNTAYSLEEGLLEIIE